MSKKKIYVVCPDRNKPLGGIKQLYRLVDILNSLGHEAFILHKKRNFRVTWYHNDTPITNFAGVFKKLNWHRKSQIMRFLEAIFFGKKMPEEGSILVFPEVYGPNLNVFKEYPIIIYNQNCYYSFEKFPYFKPSISPYNNPNLLGCMVVSEDSKKYLSLYYPSIKIERIRIGLSDVFNYSNAKKKQVAFMPRKLEEDANQIYQYIWDKEYFEGWKFVPIDGLNEVEVANVLKESAVFLSFNYKEGFGLPPVEAMACGCFVIGYAGNAGNEYFKPEFSIKIPDRDILAYLSALENTILDFNKNKSEIINKGKIASTYVLGIYNKVHEKQDVERSWNNLIETLNQRKAD